MSYGLHWEWRGFGDLEDAARNRIATLRPLPLLAGQIYDEYIWTPRCNANVKLRSRRPVDGLKFKRLIQNDEELQLQLWLERLEEDYAFPIHPGVVSELARVLDIELSVDRPIGDPGELIALLQDTSSDVCVIPVEKSRLAFAWGHYADSVLVELTDIRAPVATVTVGLEDAAHLGESSSAATVVAAGQRVAAARADLGLPAGLETKSYLDVLPTWFNRT